MNTEAKEKLGIRGGFQHSSMYNVSEQNSGRISNPLTGFYVGAYRLHTIGLREIFTLNGGLEYMATGFRIDDNSFRKLHYASIPLFARLKLGPLFGQAGFNLNFKVKEEFTLSGVDALNTIDKAPFFDLPLQVGVGVKILILTIEARYHYGLTDLGGDTRNAYLQLGIGVHI